MGYKEYIRFQEVDSEDKKTLEPWYEQLRQQLKDWGVNTNLSGAKLVEYYDINAKEHMDLDAKGLGGDE